MAGKHDGKVTISTALDNDGVEKGIQEVSGEFGGLKNVVDKTGKAISGAMSKAVSDVRSNIKKELAAVQREIASCQKQIEKAQSDKMPLVEQAEQLGVALDEAKMKLAELQAQQEAAGAILSAADTRELSGTDLNAYLDAYSQKPELDAAVLQQTAQVDKLQKEWDSVNNRIDRYDDKIRTANGEMDALQETADDLAEEMKKAEKESKKMRDNAAGSKKELCALGKSVDSFASRLKSIALGALLFNGISAGLREFTSYLGKTLKTNEAFTTELSRLKGALLTAFQPIYNAIAPAITYLMKLLTGAAMAVAEFFASLTGSTVEASAEAAKGLYEEAKALEDVEKNAKKAGKSMAGFDELNVLQEKSDVSGSAGSTDAVTPDFSVSEWWSDGELNTIKDTFKEIAGYIGVAAAGIAGFKLGNFIADLLTSEKKAKSLKTTLSKLGKKAGLVIGITLAITGIALETKGIVDTIREGLSGNALLDILGGGATITAGGAMIGQFFGKGVLGGAVGAIVGGIPAYITGIYDACMNGLNWLNASLVAAGSTMAGAGIGAIVGSAAGPMGIAIGGLIGLAAGLITDGILYLVGSVNEQAVPAIDTLTEAEKRLVEEAGKAAENFRDQKAATDEALGDITAEWENTNKLAEELFKLADASGKVNEKDQARAKFIIEELEKATGLEIDMVGGVIQKYGELQGSIKEVLLAKTAEAFLSANRDDYLQAIKSEGEAWSALKITEKDYFDYKTTAEAKIAELEKEAEIVTQKRINGVGQLTAAQNTELYNQLQDLKDAIEKEKGLLEEKKTAYKKAETAYEEIQKTINEYEAAQEAALSKNYQATIDIYAKKEKIYTEHTGIVDEQAAERVAILEKEAADLYAKAADMEEKYKKGVANFTKEMVDNAYKEANLAVKKYEDAYYRAMNGLGEDMGEGLVNGLEESIPKAEEATEELVTSAIDAGEKAADAHSPSRKTIALGEDIGVGPGIGIENETDGAVKAAENQIDAVIDAYESQSAAKSGKTFGATFADGIYSSIKSIAAAGSVAVKAAMSAISGTKGTVTIPARISTPQIPKLAQGAVLPSNKPFLAMVGDQRHGTNVEAPLTTIQEAVALVMQDQTQAILGGFEASVGVQREILEAVLGIQIGDDVIGSAVARYNRKRATITGGAV